MSRSGLVVTLCIVAAPFSVRAATVKLAWDPNQETNLAGYKIYYGPTQGPPFTGTIAKEGASPITIPLASLAQKSAPEASLTGIPSCTHLYFAATAYDTAGLESDFSNKVDATIVDKPPQVVVAPGTQQGTLVISWGGLAAGDTGALSGYRVHYDIDAGQPYQGTGATQGASPITVPASAKSFQLTGLPAGVTIHVAVEAACGDGAGKLSDDATGVVPGPSCGNGTVEKGETCDPPSSCPASCDDGNNCTKDTITGSAASCTAACGHSTITACASGDGCCPPGCDNNADSDCSASCGNGTVEKGETCDPPSSCPASCDDGNSCTVDVMTGAAASCSAACGHYAVTACAAGDGCCPKGCDAASDSDCAKSGPPGTGPAAESGEGAVLYGGCAVGSPIAPRDLSALMICCALLALALIRRRR